MGKSFEWHQERFKETLGEYMRHTSRTLAVAINTKAYYIARKATWFTSKADKTKMQQQLGKFVRVARMNKRGKMVMRREVELTKSSNSDAPLVALIINKRRGKNNQKGLYGREMAVAVRAMLASRLRSIAFLKSGWLPAIKSLAPFADRGSAPEMDSAARQFGSAKGSAKEAKETDKFPTAIIINSANSTRDKNNALQKYGGSGLKQAFEDETRSMMQYINDKMKPDADRFNKEQR